MTSSGTSSPAPLPAPQPGEVSPLHKRQPRRALSRSAKGSGPVAEKAAALMQRPLSSQEQDARDGINAAARVLAGFSYNAQGSTFDVNKRRKLAALLGTAQDIVSRATMIQCVEATFVGLMLTQRLPHAVRYPISFTSRTREDGKEVQHKHLVLGVKVGRRHGALGISRDSGLMTKEIRFNCLFDLLRDYAERYRAIGHDVVCIKLGRPITTTALGSQPVWHGSVVECPQGFFNKLRECPGLGLAAFDRDILLPQETRQNVEHSPDTHRAAVPKNWAAHRRSADAHLRSTSAPASARPAGPAAQSMSSPQPPMTTKDLRLAPQQSPCSGETAKVGSSEGSHSFSPPFRAHSPPRLSNPPLSGITSEGRSDPARAPAASNPASSMSQCPATPAVLAAGSSDTGSEGKALEATRSSYDSTTDPSDDPRPRCEANLEQLPAQVPSEGSEGGEEGGSVRCDRKDDAAPELPVGRGEGKLEGALASAGVASPVLGTAQPLLEQPAGAAVAVEFSDPLVEAVPEAPAKLPTQNPKNHKHTAVGHSGPQSERPGRALRSASGAAMQRPQQRGGPSRSTAPQKRPVARPGVESRGAAEERRNSSTVVPAMQHQPTAVKHPTDRPARPNRAPSRAAIARSRPQEAVQVQPAPRRNSPVAPFAVNRRAKDPVGGGSPKALASMAPCGKSPVHKPGEPIFRNEAASMRMQPKSDRQGLQAKAAMDNQGRATAVRQPFVRTDAGRRAISRPVGSRNCTGRQRPPHSTAPGRYGA